MSKNASDDRRNVLLVGAGVVGFKILEAHVHAGVAVCLADVDPAAVRRAVDRLAVASMDWRVSECRLAGDWIPAIRLEPPGSESIHELDWLVVESIAEKIEIKQTFFAQAERHLGTGAVLCSNTSTLRISRIADSLNRPERFCGMHFFMPVHNRDAVEIIAGQHTDDATIAICREHVRRLGKEPLFAGDGPGFIVNRLLSPYLNEAMLLLCRGISADRIERAARRYGMPMSPLELIDWIGTRTMFDAGRVYWQAFPTRLRPAALLSAMVKSGRSGRGSGGGFYDYANDQRSADLATQTLEFCERYQRDVMTLSDDDVMHLLAIPMWIEAALACREGIVQSVDQLDLAMRGGLGYDPNRSWLGFFDGLGSKTILRAIERFAEITPCISAPSELIQRLQIHQPSDALVKFAADRPLRSG